MSNGVGGEQNGKMFCPSSSIQLFSTSASTGDDRELEMAKQWTYYIEAFKTTVDCLYEICRQKQSVVGCKEAIMYLSNAVRDFETLIKSINVEKSWETEDQPHAVAWEIRKTTTSPSRITGVDVMKKRDSEMLIDALNVSPVVVHEVVRDTEEKINAVMQSATLKNDPAEEKENSKENLCTSKHETHDGDWCIVKGRCKIKKIVSQSVKCGTSKKSGVATNNDESPSQVKKTTMNVYERLTSGVLRPPNPRSPTLSSSVPGTRLTCPRSAMDLPQTKASMAKMAYSRQLLWLKHKPFLTEKLERKRRLDLRKALTNVNSHTSTSRTTRLSAINFNDPAAVCKSAKAFKQRQQNDYSRSVEKKDEVFPATSEEKEETNKKERLSCGPSLGISTPINEDLSTVRRNKYVTLSCPVLPEGMDPDDIWTAMTEEEESLLQEEQSLTKEIEEEESISIDDELERKVAAEGNFFESSSVTCDSKQLHVPQLETEKQHPTLQDLVNNIKKEMEEYASMSWGEIVEREITHYRKPGDFAQIHEKLLSPSRGRKQESTNRCLEERQQRAEELRQMLQDQKAKRLKELSAKVEEVRRKRAEIIERKKKHLQKRMEKAEENRQKSIDDIIKKARDDDVKVMQISFINELEARNMRHDMIAKSQGWEQRAHQLAEERARKVGEKAAREAAAEERRRTADTERTERLREKAVKKLARCAEIELQKLEQEKERTSAVKEKHRQRFERVAEKKAFNAANLKKRIEEKQKVTLRRYEEALAQVKQRASEMSSPKQIEWIASMVDFSRFPSDGTATSPRSSPVCSTVKKCKRCNCKVYGKLNLMAHLLFGDHLESKMMKICDVDYEYLKCELEACIADCSDEETASTNLTKPEPLKPVSVNKKKRARLRQKLIIQVKEYTLKFNDTSTVTCGSPPSKNIIEKPIRELVEAVKSIIGGDIITDCLNGTCRDTFNDRKNDLSIMHATERTIGEIQWTINSAITDKKQHIDSCKYIYKSSLLDALLTLLSFSYSGGPFASHKTQMKASGLLSKLVSSSEILWRSVFYTNRLLIILDALSINIKAYFNHSCASNDAIYTKIFPAFSFLFLLISCCKQYAYNPAAEISFRGERLSVLLSYLLVVGFHDFCSAALSTAQFVGMKTGKKKPETPYQLVIVALSLEFICMLDETLKDLGFVENVRLNRLFPTDSSPYDKNAKTVFSMLLPVFFRTLVFRLYSSFTSGISFLETMFCSTHSAYPIGYDVTTLIRDNFSGDTLCKYFLKLWIIFARREAIKAKALIHDPGVSLRIVHILSFLVVTVSEQLSTPNKKLSAKVSTECSMKDILLSIGYFAHLDEKAQMLCVFGWQKSILVRLCELPFSYFSNHSLMMELFPTLCAICFKNDPALEQLKRILSPVMLVNFLKEAKFEEIPENGRFPDELWSEAIEYLDKT